MIGRLFFLVICVIALCSHDMFLKLDSYFLEPGQAASVRLFNGTFTKSENTISRDRMLDASIVSPAGREQQDDIHWTDEGNHTVLRFTTGEAGTYVAGVSTKSRMIHLPAEDFNDYLQHDGVLDVLEMRRNTGRLEEDAHELYSKHVKAIFQTGEQRTSEYKTILGYPIEFVPQVNPYDLSQGDRLSVRLLRDGKHLTGQLVYAGHHSRQHSHSAGEDHDHNQEIQLRTDTQGLIDLEITAPGYWYLRTIHMEERAGEELDYESNWATMTFQIR